MPGLSRRSHRRRDAGCVVVKQRAPIQHPFAVVRECVAAEEPGQPLAVRKEFLPRITRGKDDRPRGGVTDGNGVGQDRLHPCIGRERLALLDPDRPQTSPAVSGSTKSPRSCCTTSFSSS